MNNKLSPNVAHVMKYIDSNWPQIQSRIIAGIKPFDNGFGIGTGLCTHPELIGERWISSIGSKLFAETTLPEGFQCLGLQNRGGSEYLFMMWFINGRRFWFYDQYVVFVGEGFPASKERTSKRLDAALERWDATVRDVLYSGIDDRFIDIEGYK